MRYILALLIISCVRSVGLGGTLVITSLTGNGELTWTNSTGNASYTVLWAASLAGPWHSFDDLTNLNRIRATNTTVKVQVPMFYRVLWNDAPQVTGDWDFNGYRFDGTLVVKGLISLTNSASSGVALGSWAFEAVPGGTNSYEPSCSSGDVDGGIYESSRLALNLNGCGLAEGAYFLEGRLVEDTWSGIWAEEGIAVNPVGTFTARKRPN